MAKTGWCSRLFGMEISEFLIAFLRQGKQWLCKYGQNWIQLSATRRKWIKQCVFQVQSLMSKQDRNLSVSSVVYSNYRWHGKVDSFPAFSTVLMADILSAESKGFNSYFSTKSSTQIFKYSLRDILILFSINIAFSHKYDNNIIY